MKRTYKKSILKHKAARLLDNCSIVSKMKRLIWVVVRIEEHGLRTNTYFGKVYVRNKSDFNPFSIFISNSEINVTMIKRT